MLDDLEKSTLGATTLDARNRRRIWSKCSKCGVEKWALPKYKTVCFQCSIQPGCEYVLGGQTLVRLTPKDPYYEMTIYRGELMGYGWTSKARYVMAKHLGRCLTPEEWVTFKSKDKNNFDPTNLKLHFRKLTASKDNPLESE